MNQLPPPATFDEDIATYEVSEDGVTWRPYDAAADRQLILHTRICFAAPRLEGDRDEAPLGPASADNAGTKTWSDPNVQRA